MQVKHSSRVDTAIEVVFRSDFMTCCDTRVATLVVYAATLAGAIILLVQFVNIMTKDASTNRFQHNAVYIWNVSCGGTCLTLITGIFVAHLYRVLQANRQHKIWKPQQKRLAILFLAEAGVQWVNLVFYVAANVSLLIERCYFFSPVLTSWFGWVRWTCWNTLFMLFLVHAYQGREVPAGPTPRLYVDGPWRLLWPCILPWILLEVVLSIMWISNAAPGLVSKYAAEFSMCKQNVIVGYLSECGASATTRIYIDLMVGIAISYFVLTCMLLLWKLRQHKKCSYTAVHVGAVFFTLQLRLRVIVMVFYTLCLVLLWLVRSQSCASFEFAWLGIMPMQVVMTANAFVWNFISMPVVPTDNLAVERVWAQEFAWTEVDKPIKHAVKALTDPDNDRLKKQSIFCFETMMHMLYWSCLVYDYKRASPQHKRKHVNTCEQAQPSSFKPGEPEKTSLTLHTAMGLYKLTDSELFWELQLDTRCLMGWNASTIVLAFRGTASMANALADLQAWRVAHPPLRGRTWCCSRPLVHVGFMKSWLAGNFNQKIVHRVMDLVHTCQPGTNKLKIYVTGHSLGGALATLAAYDICKQLQEAQHDTAEVICYSFGAPRTGNHAFADDYNRMVPDTWSIINDQDVVTREGKFVFLYKRPGNRVIVNKQGHMMVSPSFMESSVQQSTAGQSVEQHFLTSYHHSIMAVILAQFSRIGFSDGMEGVVSLVKASPYLKDLLEIHMGMQLDQMQRLAQLSPAARILENLPGAHMPARGFYRIKATTSQVLNFDRVLNI
ncbi:hypothetical protein WJX77_006522 [Trebouxia sp. C0004]